MKILAVEDDPVASLMIEALLKSMGHEVILAADGNDALAALQRTPVRVVVSDWQMVGGDGLELCRKIRAMPGDYVYFILLTQHEATDGNERLAMQAGVDDFLTKPVRPRDMRMRLHVAERILGYTQQVKQLETFLPICGYCKKIRDDKNYWEQVETYISKHTGSQFSHGVCPDCYQNVLLPEMTRLGISDPMKPPTAPARDPQPQ